MNHYGVGHPNASNARCNERTLSDKDSQKLIQFYQASGLLGWSLGRMCRWYVVDFILICGRARFWWGWVWRDGSFLNAVLGWNFTNLVRLKWMYVIAMATWWGQHMCVTFKPNDSKWLQSYVYFIAFMFFSGTYVCQVMQLKLLKSGLADSALFSTLCCRICPACSFYGWHIPQHSPFSLWHSIGIPYRQQILPGVHSPGLP
jgi:hypothetical protein